MYYLYKYLDPTTEECLYIGQTKNIYTRHLAHLCNKNEDWCNSLIKMKYTEIPDKYNLNFLEMYLINKEMPKYNSSGKGRMDHEFIKIEFNPDWKNYTKEDFLKNSIEKGRNLGINYKISIENKNLFKSLLLENRLKEVEYTKSGVTAKFEVNKQTIESILKNYVVDVEFHTLEIDGFGAVIGLGSSYRKDKNNNFVFGTLEFILNIKFLESMINSLFEPTEELYEIIDIVNKFLSMIGIDKDWEAVLNEIEGHKSDIKYQEEMD